MSKQIANGEREEARNMVPESRPPPSLLAQAMEIFIAQARIGTPMKLLLGPYEVSIADSGGDLTLSMSVNGTPVLEPHDLPSFLELVKLFELSRPVVFANEATRQLTAVSSGLLILPVKTPEELSSFLIEKLVNPGLELFVLRVRPCETWQAWNEVFGKWLAPEVLAPLTVLADVVFTRRQPPQARQPVFGSGQQAAATVTEVSALAQALIAIPPVLATTPPSAPAARSGVGTHESTGGTAVYGLLNWLQEKISHSASAQVSDHDEEPADEAISALQARERFDQLLRWLERRNRLRRIGGQDDPADQFDREDLPELPVAVQLSLPVLEGGRNQVIAATIRQRVTADGLIEVHLSTDLDADANELKAFRDLIGQLRAMPAMTIIAGSIRSSANGRL